MRKLKYLLYRLYYYIYWKFCKVESKVFNKPWVSYRVTYTVGKPPDAVKRIRKN